MDRLVIRVSLIVSRSPCRDNAASFFPHCEDDGYLYVVQQTHSRPAVLSITIGGSDNVRAPEDFLRILEIDFVDMPIGLTFGCIPLELDKSRFLDQNIIWRRLCHPLAPYIQL